MAKGEVCVLCCVVFCENLTQRNHRLFSATNVFRLDITLPIFTKDNTRTLPDRENRCVSLPSWLLLFDLESPSFTLRQPNPTPPFTLRQPNPTQPNHSHSQSYPSLLYYNTLLSSSRSPTLVSLPTPSSSVQSNGSTTTDTRSRFNHPALPSPLLPLPPLYQLC